MNFGMISILVPFLLGVANSRHISFPDNVTYDQPIITKVQERRICAELCMVGLGGEPCGEDCRDMIPQGLPVSQSQNNTVENSTFRPRSEVCPVLCDNRLGWPLCNCNYTQVSTPFFKANFMHVCAAYCEKYNYQIYGCHSCNYYKDMTSEKLGIVAISAQISKKSYSWDEWCKQMCDEGEGGSACYCDLLPLTLQLNNVP